jgi:hypothetical protein
MSKKLGVVMAAAKRAKALLSSKAEYAIEHWQHANWDSGMLEKAFSGRGDPNLKTDIDHAFAPVKAVLKAQFGKTIPLYRGQRIYPSDALSKGRMLFSWTATPKVAKHFAHNRLMREISDEEIAACVAQYERTGYAKIGREKFVRIKDNLEYFNIFKGLELITDGDDLEGYLKDEQAARLEYNTRHKAKGYVASIAMPIDDIVWITNDLACLEFICKNNPLD